MTQTLKSREVARARTPTINGRIYSRKMLQGVVHDANSRGEIYCMAQPAQDGLIVVNQITHRATNFRLIRDSLMCDIETLETPAGLSLPDLRDAQFHIYGFGEVNEETGEVTAYQLQGVGIYLYSIYGETAPE